MPPLQGVRDLKDRLVQPAHLRNAAVVQEKLNQTYQALLGMVGKDNPFGFQEATLKKLLGDLESFIWPCCRGRPRPLTPTPLPPGERGRGEGGRGA